MTEASCSLDEELGRGPGAADEMLLGHWHNTHHGSRGIPEIALERRGDRVAVRVWGAGAQGLADWGEAPGELFTCVEEDGVRSAAALARYDFGFMGCELQIRQNKGILAVTTFNRFRDGSGRSSYVTRSSLPRPGRGRMTRPTRTMRRMDSALPSGGCDPPFPEAVWVNTNAEDRVQGFRWLEMLADRLARPLCRLRHRPPVAGRRPGALLRHLHRGFRRFQRPPWLRRR